MAEWIEPHRTSYRGTDVYALGANTQGIATLQMLNILENFDLKGAGFQSALSIHLQAEAKRLAYEDRARYYADPHFSNVPVEWLISKDYAAERARLIRPDRILTPVHPGQAPSHGDTTYFSVADKDGMMVSMIQSNFRGMGSGLVADGLGFMFQDRGQLFSLQDGHPNIYAPGKRPFQTIIPGFAAHGDTPWMSFGVMGGDMQPQGQTQIMVNRIDYGLEIQAAGDSPRWHHEGSSQSMGEDAPGLGPKGLLRLEICRGERDARRRLRARLLTARHGRTAQRSARKGATIASVTRSGRPLALSSKAHTVRARTCTVPSALVNSMKRSNFAPCGLSATQVRAVTVSPGPSARR